MNLDDQLKSLSGYKDKNWGRLLHLLKKSFDEWASRELTRKGYTDFKMGYMPFIMNIGVEGATNNELAQKACITKQAMSKIVSELEELKFITTKVNKNDRRSTMIYLTNKGKHFVIEVINCVESLKKEYKKQLGEERFEATFETIKEIIDYHKTIITPRES